MIEIIVLWQMCKSLGVKVRSKGYRAFTYQLILVLSWFAGQIIGAAIGGITIGVILGEQGEEALILGYIPALLVAILSAWLVFIYVKNLPQREEVDDIELAEDL